MSYNYFTSDIQDNTIHSINQKVVDYNISDKEYILNARNKASQENTRLKNKYSSR